MSEYPYAVTSEETRVIADEFLAVHRYLDRRWGLHYGDRNWPVFDRGDIPQGNGDQWCAQVTEPAGQTFLIDHEVVLQGLRRVQHEDAAIEASVISTWMTQPRPERQANVLPPWAASRICQLGLFGDRDSNKFPYQLHSLGSSLEQRQEFAADFLVDLSKEDEEEEQG